MSTQPDLTPAEAQRVVSTVQCVVKVKGVIAAIESRCKTERVFAMLSLKDGKCVVKVKGVIAAIESRCKTERVCAMLGLKYQP